MQNGNGCKLHVVSFGLAIGTTWAIGMFLTALIAWQFGIGNSFVLAIAEYYRGLDLSLLGCFIGAFWGFLDGFVGGVMISFFYNLYCRCSCCCRTKVE